MSLEEPEIKTLKVRASYKHTGTFYSLCRGSTAARLLAGSSDYAIYVFDPTAEKLEPVGRWVKHDNYVSALVPIDCAGRKLIVSGSFDRQLIWWDEASGESIRSIEAHQGWIRDVTAIHGGNTLASVGDDMLVRIWDATDASLVRSLAGHSTKTPQGHVTALYAVTAAADGKHIASGDRIGEVRIWETDSGKLAQSFQVPILYTYDPTQRKRSIGGIRSLAFSPDGKHLAVGGIGQIGNVDGLAGPAHIELWDWQKPELLFTAEADGHKAIIEQLRFSPDGTFLTGAGGGSDDGLIAFWTLPVGPTDSERVATGKEDKPTSPVHRMKCDLHVHRFDFDHPKNELIAAGHGKLEVWSGSEPGVSTPG